MGFCSEKFNFLLISVQIKNYLSHYFLFGTAAFWLKHLVVLSAGSGPALGMLWASALNGGCRYVRSIELLAPRWVPQPLAQGLFLLHLGFLAGKQPDGQRALSWCCGMWLNSLEVVVLLDVSVPHAGVCPRAQQQLQVPWVPLLCYWSKNMHHEQDVIIPNNLP